MDIRDEEDKKCIPSTESSNKEQSKMTPILGISDASDSEDKGNQLLAKMHERISKARARSRSKEKLVKKSNQSKRNVQGKKFKSPSNENDKPTTNEEKLTFVQKMSQKCHNPKQEGTSTRLALKPSKYSPKPVTKAL